ncbi:MAG: hypothetical protein ABEJ87_03335 [Candidatus Nanohalobium sp.]
MDDGNREDYAENADLDDADLYDRFTDDEGLSINYPGMEPDPERWATVVQHDRYRDSMSQLDDLMRDYDRPIELHVGEGSFRDLNHDNMQLPDRLNFYIAEDRDEFLEEVNHPVFQELGSEEFTVPKGTEIGLAFGGYRDVVDVPEHFEFLDVKVPTFFSHLQHDLQQALDDVQSAYVDDQETLRQALEEVEAEYGEDVDLDSGYF